MTKILVIEDEAMLREDILEWLMLEGYEAVGAGDGVEGVNAALLHQPDLIVCDINMPRLNGYGVLADVQSNSITHATPFIFLTAQAALGDLRKGMALGADDYVTKPFARTDLMHAIETRLDKKAAQEDEYQQQIRVFKEALTHERTQRLLQTKIVALFSHDFRTSLTAIQHSQRLVRDFLENDQPRRGIPQVNRAEALTSQLIHMLDELLLLAEMETSGYILKPERIIPGVFLEAIIEEFQTIYGATHQIILENNCTTSLAADPRLLRPIVANLISNAVKYSAPGSTVSVAVSQGEEGCALTVTDHGAGIPEDAQSDLFAAFDSDHHGAETGLGLAIVKQAVDEHGGSITFESQVGVGTTFTVSLPLQQV